MSITYNGTTYEETGLYNENYTLLATDKYQNRVNTSPGISLSMITGYAKDAIDGRRLFSYPDINTTLQGQSPGRMDPINNIFEVIGRNGYIPNFTSLDEGNDFLFTFGQGYTYNASGKWDITNNGVASNQLQLNDNFDANDTIVNMGYVVGHNYRQDTCRPGAEYTGIIYMDSNVSTLNVDGIAKVKIDYPYYLGGKTVFIGAEIIGRTANGDIISKFGEVKKVTLRTTGFDDRVESIPASTTNATVYMPISLKDAPEWYRNANFGLDILTSDNITYTTAIYHGEVGSCNNVGAGDGVAYVEIQGVTEHDGSTGTISIKNIVVSSEF
jgi:hypothetical protein